MKVTTTPDMVGRANALAPELPYETVKAMLEAALSSLPLPVACEIRDQVIADNKPDLVKALLSYLRLHGFALVYYGGDVLHQAVGAPTAGKSWYEDLMEAASGAARTPAQASARLPADAEMAVQLSEAIQASLFDLNAAGEAGVAIAKSISNGSCKV